MSLRAKQGKEQMNRPAAWMDEDGQSRGFFFSAAAAAVFHS